MSRMSFEGTGINKEAISLCWNRTAKLSLPVQMSVKPWCCWETRRCPVSHSLVSHPFRWWLSLSPELADYSIHLYFERDAGWLSWWRNRRGRLPRKNPQKRQASESAYSADWEGSMWADWVLFLCLFNIFFQNVFPRSPLICHPLPLGFFRTQISDQKCQPYLPRSLIYLTRCSKHQISLYWNTLCGWHWMKEDAAIDFRAWHLNCKYSFLLKIEVMFKGSHLRGTEWKIPQVFSNLMWD